MIVCIPCRLTLLLLLFSFLVIHIGDVSDCGMGEGLRGGGTFPLFK